MPEIYQPQKQPVYAQEVIAAFSQTNATQHLVTAVINDIKCWNEDILTNPQILDSPALPAFRYELLDNSSRKLQACIDLRRPAFSPWINIIYSMALFKRNLKYGHDQFQKISHYIFDDPSRFRSPAVKYLHPAIEYTPKGHRISAYWNLGKAHRNVLWEKTIEVTAMLGASTQRLQKLKAIFGDIAQPEILGLDFDKSSTPYLKTYLFFDNGFNLQDMKQALHTAETEKDVSVLEKTVNKISSFFSQSRSPIWICSVYNPLTDNPQPGPTKIHLQLGSAFPEKLTVEKTVSICKKPLSEIGLDLQDVTNDLQLENGQSIKLYPSSLSFGFSPEQGLSKVSLYTGFTMNDSISNKP